MEATMLPRKETLTIEFKSDLKKYSDSDIVEAVVAFANTEGGDLYLGIEDSGEVSGVHGDHADATRVSAFIANHTIPPVSVRAGIVDEGKQVLKISVPRSLSGVVAAANGKVLHRRLKADGSPENVPMYPYEFATRLSDLRLMDYSALPLYEASVSDFDPLETARLRNCIRTYHGDQSVLELSDTDLCKALGFVREAGGVWYPTVAGMLMLGRADAISRYVPTEQTSFQVLDGTKVLVNEDFVQPVLQSIERLFSSIQAWNPEQELEDGLFRIGVPEFDKRAVREAVVNAFSHRDYARLGRVRVAIDDRGLTIANPGGFVEGITLDNLLTAEPRGRNPLLADALKRIGLAEKTGRGIDRIYEGSLAYGKALPDYSASTSAGVVLRLPRSKPDSWLTRLISGEQKRLGRPLSLDTLFVLHALQDAPRKSVTEIAGETHIPSDVVRTVLETFTKDGIAEAFGKRRGRTYMLSSRVYDTKEARMGYVRQADIDESRYEELVLDMARANPRISRSDVARLLYVDPNKAYRILSALVDKGKLALTSRGRYATYRYVGKS